MSFEDSQMKISLNWLKDYVEFDPKLSIEDIRWKLTEATAEIEGADELGKNLERIVVGKITKVESHPDADRLRVCQVDVGSEEVQIVCGGANLQEDMKVIVSLPGSKVRWHGEGDLVEVKAAKLRGVKSTGMICAAEEVGLADLFPEEGPKDISDISHLDVEAGTPVSEALNIDDVVFEIDNHSITHRSDLFSHYGFARECVALGLGTWKKKIEITDPADITGRKDLPLQVKIEDESLSKNYLGTIIENISTKQAPDWMKSRLNAVGIRSINAIVDVTNYIMMDVGQPNHAFDLRALEGKTFTNRYSQKGEKVKTLDSIERELEEGIIIGETEEGIIDLAGVMGGEDSEVKDDTTSVYFHSAQFNNVAIRKAIISLGHRTDGATMHEKDIEPERSLMGFLRGLELFKEVFPEAAFNYQTLHLQRQESPKVSVQLPVEKIKQYVGISIPNENAVQYLQDLGFQVEQTEDTLSVDVPSWRVNGVQMQQDIIEEIIRIHGYSNVPAEAPPITLETPVRDHKRHVKRTLQNFLTGQGFQEEVNFSFLSEEHLQNANIENNEEIIEIANPVSEDFRFMRPNFLPYLFSNLNRNQAQQQRVWKRFETGAVYKRVQQDVIEEHLLTLVLAQPGKETAFHNLLEQVKKMFNELSMECSIEDQAHKMAYPKRSVQIEVGGKSIGFVYELHPLIKDNFRLKGSIVVAEISLDELYQVPIQETYYQELKRHPRALLDINVVVDEQKRMQDVQNIIKNVQSEYLSSLELIDVFQGESLGERKKSFTFALSYQHPERTLEEQEIQNILDELIKALESDGGLVRR